MILPGVWPRPLSNSIWKGCERIPLTALALYDEYRELTPAGSEGDEMIGRLADRLVGVDLLDRAVALLDHQIKFRLKGEKRVEVRTKLR